MSKKTLPHGLGRVPSKFDARDYDLQLFINKEISPRIPPIEKSWDFPCDALDQGDTSHCVGFSGANFGLNYPTHTRYTNQDGHNFYYLCKKVDGEPNKENGSTIRSLAKVFKSAGKIEGYAFASDMNAIKWWVLNRGPMVMGTAWTYDMFAPDEDNIVHITGDIAGGHAYLINEYRKDGYYGIQNSWGNEWGVKGKAYIHEKDLARLFKYNGEAMTAIEIEGSGKTPCPLVEFIRKLLQK